MPPQRLQRARNRALRRVLAASQRVGIDVLPRHFYSQVPDLRRLRDRDDWRRAYSMVAVRGADVRSQVEWLQGCMSAPADERLADRDLWAEACERAGEPGYGPAESHLLYCVVAAKRPRRVIQVGAGVSTAVITAARSELSLPIDVVCIDPHPSAYLRDLDSRAEITLVAEPAETVPLDTLTGLEAGDMLFVDSTHAVRPGGEVNRVVLEALPRLPRGCLAHFHDITFPHDFSPRILADDVFFWGESTLLHAFLAGNERFALRASLSMLHGADPEALRRLIPPYRPARTERGVAREPLGAEAHFPTAAYIEAIA